MILLASRPSNTHRTPSFSNNYDLLGLIELKGQLLYLCQESCSPVGQTLKELKIKTLTFLTQEFHHPVGQESGVHVLLLTNGVPQ